MIVIYQISHHFAMEISPEIPSFFYAEGYPTGMEAAPTPRRKSRPAGKFPAGRQLL